MKNMSAIARDDSVKIADSSVAKSVKIEIIGSQNTAKSGVVHELSSNSI
ncbi:MULTISPECIES: hypothetical protein [unclassified Tolypothrix]|nr:MULTISPECIES: hypothetical protein [unclassified Tolypothrix]BAY91851.1 hypothetical protein NIES3275_38790 [Microchaete diplosiphon NIES-3275]EKF04990.1 hypothetical protein FDUTEX481_01154 [Tolypothrix sp. PCC 7601]MBE9081259.1 hypothetical protein [Tolypothrix sp. LEGE 11397]UYD25860.1 hypothetical protein HGR01_31775 [Tolypothrix sp. PCC 7712]UYD31902.1 hypothetical protein HG267_22755 [Tolypothrix sp. PCC 7601]